MYRFSELVALSWSRYGLVSIDGMCKMHRDMDKPDLELSVSLYKDMTDEGRKWWDAFLEVSHASGIVVIFDLDRVVITYDKP